MRYVRILIAVLFVLLALSAWSQVVLVFTGASDDPPPLMIWQAVVGASGLAAAWGAWKRKRWASAAATTYGVVTGAMIVALGPLLDLDPSARGGLWTGGIAVLGFGVGSGLLLRRMKE